MAATEQAQAEATKEAQRAGIAYAKAQGGKYLGRKPSFTTEQASEVLTMLSEGVSPSEIAKRSGLSRQTIYRLKDDPSCAERTSMRWESQKLHK